MNEGTRPLEGRVALVTGGGGGLGAATCLALAEAGASVVAADVRRDCAERAAQAVEATGAKALPLALDVTDEGDARRGVRATLDAFGRLDVLVNNAGIDVTLPVADLEVADWDRVLGVNLRGPFLMSKAALEALRDSRGQIVNVVSTAAKRAWPNASAYHASKWGLLGLSHALHAELRPAGVKVTAVVAGGMRTPFLTDRFPDIDLETLQDPKNVAETIRLVLTLPPASVVPEVMVLPMGETSWP
jgi:NAD(P)-dependent dehydrogenase (short-subunit alcohol dehydrogenase family)